MAVKITNEMKANCIGEFTFESEEACPKCSLMLDEQYENIECLCGDSNDGLYMQKRDVPWDTCKEIYKGMAKHDPRLSDDPLTALAAVMRVHNIIIELDHDSEMSSVTIKNKSKELYYIERDDSVGLITANDIKPE